MYVKNIIFHNRAPFEALNMELSNNDIAVLTAVNGKGKTTILSYVMDAWVEMTKDVFYSSYEGRRNDYYRISSPLYEIEEGKPSFVYIRFNHNNKDYDYLDIRRLVTEVDYNRIVCLNNKIPYRQVRNRLEKHISSKIISDSLSESIVKEVFNNQVNIYFPAYRNEQPNYLNEKYALHIDYATSGKWNSELINPLEVNSSMKQLSSWLMDLLLDRYVNKTTVKRKDSDVENTPELQVWLNVRKVIASALSSKYPDGKVRLGIGRRNYGDKRIAIMDYSDNQLCPSIFTLSTGEQALISLFGELLRQADRLNTNISMDNIHGIVLIDEIDKHLHMTLQKDVLPKMLMMFPNVQFIVSSHSPFFSMGLADDAANRSRVFDLDNNGKESSPINNEVYQAAYESFVNDRKKYAVELDKLKETVSSIQKPLIITEGKTDIKHIQKAIEKLGYQLTFESLPAEEQPDGASNVDRMIQELKRVRQEHKVIAIFDRDLPDILRKYPDPYQDLGNNVYALCIACPQCRKDEDREAISIEYLYSDDEIHSVLPDGTQLYFGNEFENTSVRRHITDKSLRLNMKDGCGKDKIVENNGSQAVFDNNDINHLAKKDAFAEAIINDQIAISDQSWENFRPTIDIIQTIMNL